MDLCVLARPRALSVRQASTARLLRETCAWIASLANLLLWQDSLFAHNASPADLVTPQVLLCALGALMVWALTPLRFLARCVSSAVSRTTLSSTAESARKASFNQTQDRRLVLIAQLGRPQTSTAQRLAFAVQRVTLLRRQAARSVSNAGPGLFHRSCLGLLMLAWAAILDFTIHPLPQSTASLVYQAHIRT
jgi:hypothetical protein